MAGRPRKDIKTKNRNGTGTISSNFQKIDRKGNRLSKMCKICSQCEDRSICNNREGTKKCKKCLECNGKDCDRFYVYAPHTALSSTKGGKKRKYLGRYNKKEEAQESIIQSQNGGFIETNNITLYEVLEKKNTKNLEANAISTSTYDRNRAIRNKMRKYGLADKRIQKISTDEIQDYLNNLKDSYSQSEIDKQTDEIKSGYKYAIVNHLVLKNPCENLIQVISSLPVKNARPFELDEQNLLIDYINTHDNLTDIRSSMDSITFRNVVKLAFATGQRIGELLALQIGYDKKHYTSDINFEKKYFRISKTISTENNKPILKNGTKNYKKRIRKGLPPYIDISFNIANDDVIENILKEQIEHSKNNPNNKQHFLFCNNEGNFLTHQKITETFKRICKQLHIQEDNSKGCHIHQARHSFVTRCLEAGMNIETIADIIGDNIEQVLDTYAHILKRFKDDELDKLHNYYEKNNIIF